MHQGTTVRVILIGSGIAGLSAAIALRKVGIETTVCERASELREVGAGISLWANAIRALDHLGVGQTVRSHSLPLERSELRGERGRTILGSFSAADMERQIGIAPAVAMIHRAELVSALAGFLPRETIRFGHECVHLLPREKDVLVRFTNGHEDQADAIVGADGIRSVVRKSLFGSDEPRYAGYTCWRGICRRPASILPGYMGEWWGRGKRFGITTLPQDRVYWFAVCNAPAVRMPPDHHAVVSELFEDWADPVPEIVASTPPAQIIHSDIVDRPPVEEWSRGRIGLIGDAIHPTTPNLGQGGCMAIEDSVALACSLIRHHDPAEAFQEFAAGRKQRTSRITKESWKLGKIAQWEGPVSCWLRERLVRTLFRLLGPGNLCKYAKFDIGPLPVRETP